MAKTPLVALPCRLSRGMFSSERAFEVKLANGETYTGGSPRHYCWHESGLPLETDGATDREINGLIAARIVDDDLEAGQVAVEVPDGEVLAVFRDHLRPRPTPLQPSPAASLA